MWNSKLLIISPEASIDMDLSLFSFSRKQIDGESQLLIQQHQQQQQQQQLVPLQDSYMQSRAEALQNVDSTIHELSTIFNQLATLVSQQGDLAIRFHTMFLYIYILHQIHSYCWSISMIWSKLFIAHIIIWQSLRDIAKLVSYLS